MENSKKQGKAGFRNYFTALWQQWFLNKHRKKFSTPVFWVYSVYENAHFSATVHSIPEVSLLPISLDFCRGNGNAAIELIWKKKCLNQIKQTKEYLISHGWLLLVRLRKPWASQEK